MSQDPALIGRTIRLNGTAYEVIGVTPAAFDGVALGAQPDVWLPMRSAAAMNVGTIAQADIWERRGSRWIGRLVARVAPGATIDRARAELFGISEQLREEDPDARGPRSITVDPLQSAALPVGSEAATRQFVWLLVGVVGLILLLACANLANLMIARGVNRQRDIALRLALGAGRGRIVRQLFTESLLLATVENADL